MIAPTVTALVPAWNAESFIEATLDSLARQDYPNLRVIVSVDVSTDRTAALCEAYAARDSRFRVICQTTRRGWVGNVNALLRRADSDYAFFAFHDDLIDPPYVGELVARLEGNPGAVVTFSDMDTIDAAGRITAQVYTALEGIADPVERAKRVMLRQGAWWVPHRGVFRTRIAREIGGLRTHAAGEFSADWPWLVHLALRGEFIRVPCPWVHKRYMKFSLSRTWAFSSAQHLAVTLSCLREVLRARAPLRQRLPLAAVALKLALRCVVRMASYRWQQAARWALRAMGRL